MSCWICTACELDVELPLCLPSSGVCMMEHKNISTLLTLSLSRTHTNKQKNHFHVFFLSLSLFFFTILYFSVVLSFLADCFSTKATRCAWLNISRSCYEHKTNKQTNKQKQRTSLFVKRQQVFLFCLRRALLVQISIWQKTRETHKDVRVFFFPYITSSILPKLAVCPPRLQAAR